MHNVYITPIYNTLHYFQSLLLCLCFRDKLLMIEGSPSLSVINLACLFFTVLDKPLTSDNIDVSLDKC